VLGQVREPAAVLSHTVGLHVQPLLCWLEFFLGDSGLFTGLVADMVDCG
jgi:hypothetical protein